MANFDLVWVAEKEERKKKKKKKENARKVKVGRLFGIFGFNKTKAGKIIKLNLALIQINTVNKNKYPAGTVQYSTFSK